MNYIDSLLNRITMYRTVLYALFVLAFFAIIFGFLGVISFSGILLLESVLILLVVCYFANELLAKLFKAVTNPESSSITALILFFVLSPVYKQSDILMLVIAGIIAMASKYLIAIHKKHIFNPAALAAFIIGFFYLGAALWWVGTPWLTAISFILGLLIVRKIRRFDLFLSTVIASFVAFIIYSLSTNTLSVDGLWVTLSSWPILFFASVMVTEPLTTPPTKKLRIIYGIIVGVLAGFPFHVGPVYSSPELALLLGNLFSFAVNFKRRLVLTFEMRNTLAQDTYEFIFQKPQGVFFKAGQYFEWMVAHAHPDTRGIRRYFTIASSPTENVLSLGVKFATPPSSFKNKLLSLKAGDHIIASQLAGDFTLQEHSNKKLVFIAGGIGITPFRSMIKYLLDTKDSRSITLFYSNKSVAEIAYRPLLDEAEQKLHLRTIYLLNTPPQESFKGEMEVGFLNADLVKKYLSNYTEHIYYLSGPIAMVNSYKKLLREMGVPRSQIKTDYFPGFA